MLLKATLCKKQGLLPEPQAGIIRAILVPG